MAVIPARRGSRRLPNKNLLPVAGRPLVAWTIEAALRSGACGRILVSTEDAEIAEVARAHGAETPFLRPAELARDDVPSTQAVMHALRWLADRQDYRPAYVVCLQPTSPLRTPADIVAALDVAWTRQADGVVSVTPIAHHPTWLKHLDAEGRLVDYVAGPAASMDGRAREEVFVLNGAIYIGRSDLVIDRATYYADRTYGYVMPPERSLDVDTAWDLHLVDLVLRARFEHAAR